MEGSSEGGMVVGPLLTISPVIVIAAAILHKPEDPYPELKLPCQPRLPSMASELFHMVMPIALVLGKRRQKTLCKC